MPQRQRSTVQPTSPTTPSTHPPFFFSALCQSTVHHNICSVSLQTIKRIQQTTMSKPGGGGGGVLFSEYIDDSILTPLLSRLQFITDDERLHGTDLLEDLDGIRGLMGDLRIVFARMAKNERSLIVLFDPIERLVDDVLESVTARDADVAALQPKLDRVRVQIGAIREAVAGSSSYDKIEKEDQPPQGKGGAREDFASAPAAEVVYDGGEHMAHLRRAVHGMDVRLRHCLLCLAAFPEGAVIKKRLLVHWWMGEGFVESADKGKARFKQLVDMRFARAVRREHCGTAHACTVHPWIRRMLVAVARSGAFLDADPDGTSKNDFARARRACLRDGGEVSPAPSRFHPEVCTVYNVDQKYVRLSDAWFRNKARLGTMQLGQWRASGASEQIADPKRSHVELIADEHLRGIGACKNLRYLSLRGISRIKAVPDAIGKLGELVVLDLRACHNLQVLTKEITKLHRLEYLDVSQCYLLVEMPEGLGKLSELQVLKGFVLANSTRKNACSLIELADLKKLRKLSIGIGKKLKRAEDELSVLAKLTSLASLKITWGMGGKESSEATRVRQLALPSTLTKLELCCFPCREFAELINPDGLRGLRKLYVTGGMLQDLGARSDPNGECRVEVLRLRYLKHLQCDWEELHGLYTELRFLAAQSCPAAANWPLDEIGLWRNSDRAGVQMNE
ncbi:disease resistance RPP13-like protein 4 [Phragmites australis]|uniref:disease resistance RPP13-like protein 4 n=1 Tax=Phragmites australis TaxID=29695 RepID=UPI002D7A3240|nr:disease resistance RPP13-like protein 4 [Phragmites australis]